MGERRGKWGERMEEIETGITPAGMRSPLDL